MNGESLSQDRLFLLNPGLAEGAEHRGAPENQETGSTEPLSE